jgi:hypothetical protein
VLVRIGEDDVLQGGRSLHGADRRVARSLLATPNRLEHIFYYRL